MKTMIIVGADHAGFRLKEKMKKFLKSRGYAVHDVGNRKYDTRDDYPDFAFALGNKVLRSKNKGILFCGSAEGICIAANKVKGVRAVAAWSLTNARLSREHNDANVLCLAGGDMLKPQGGLSEKKAQNILLTWLITPFSKEERHVRRIKKITQYEQR